MATSLRAARSIGRRIIAQSRSIAGRGLRAADTLHAYACPRKRSELPMTDTDDKLIASAARSGLSNQPVIGYRTPAAIGMPSAL